MTQYDPDNFNLAIKSVKCAGGEETPRFELNLYINNKKAAQVSNGGTGGSCMWRWDNKEFEELFNQHIKYLDSQGRFEFNFEQGDHLIYEMLAEFEENKEFKKECRTKTLFILTNSEPGCYYTIATKYSPQVKHFLIDKYGEKLKEIINQRF
jgi:hypothetical protein